MANKAQQLESDCFFTLNESERNEL